MSAPVNALFQFRHDLAANWENVNPVLMAGELGLEINTGKAKFGDGIAPWNTLNYFGIASSFSDAEIPSGLINSLNITFTLLHPPSPALSLILSMNGILQSNGSDYTLTSNSINMTAAPKTGYSLVAWYRY